MSFLVGFVSFQAIKMSSFYINNNNNNNNNMCAVIMWVFGLFHYVVISGHNFSSANKSFRRSLHQYN
jgi:uncharacterized membrane protein